jgi:hypothetical protein
MDGSTGGYYVRTIQRRHADRELEVTTRIAHPHHMAAGCARHNGMFVPVSGAN